MMIPGIICAISSTKLSAPPPRGRSLASEYAAGAASSSVSATVPSPTTRLTPR